MTFPISESFASIRIVRAFESKNRYILNQTIMLNPPLIDRVIVRKQLPDCDFGDLNSFHKMEK